MYHRHFELGTGKKRFSGLANGDGECRQCHARTGAMDIANGGEAEEDDDVEKSNNITQIYLVLVKVC